MPKKNSLHLERLYLELQGQARREVLKELEIKFTQEGDTQSLMKLKEYSRNQGKSKGVQNLHRNMLEKKKPVVKSS
ncbi:MAG: hypothetical protein ABIH59_00915 [archaeon]